MCVKDTDKGESDGRVLGEETGRTGLRLRMRVKPVIQE
jgi:hypothetical protein